MLVSAYKAWSLHEYVHLLASHSCIFLGQGRSRNLAPACCNATRDAALSVRAAAKLRRLVTIVITLENVTDVTA